MFSKIHFNWHQSGDLHGFCEDYMVYEVGKAGVELIENVSPPPGDGYNGTDVYKVTFINGDWQLIYNANQVFYTNITD